MILEPGRPGEASPLHEHPRESKGRPGSRAPHVFLQRNGEQVSTLDLFGRNYVLLAAPGGEVWPGATVAAAAALVRPDGIVAWRAADGTGASETTVRGVLTQLLCRKDPTGR